MPLLTSVFTCTVLAACGGADPELEVFTSPDHERLALPFSEAVRAGDLLFVSGQIGAKPGSLELVPGGIQAETRQVMLNLQSVLERHGSSLTRVAKCTVFIRDMGQWPQMNEVYVQFFPGHKPARSAVGASGIALGGSVEIECIAAA